MYETEFMGVNILEVQQKVVRSVGEDLPEGITNEGSWDTLRSLYQTESPKLSNSSRFIWYRYLKGLNNESLKYVCPYF